MQSISPSYPEVVITTANHQHLLSLLKTENQNNYKKIVRSLVYGILIQDDIWVNTNSKKLFESYPEVFASCLGKLSYRTIN
jgi:hypothetical protein